MVIYSYVLEAYRLSFTLARKLEYGKNDFRMAGDLECHCAGAAGLVP